MSQPILKSSTTAMTATTRRSDNPERAARPYAFELGSAWSCSSEHTSSVVLSLAQQFLQINRLLLTYLVFGCNVAALQTMLVTRDLIVASATALARLAWSIWDSKTARRLRRKLEFEFFVLILGCGNGFALIIFWPGWIFVGLVYLAYIMWSLAT